MLKYTITDTDAFNENRKTAEGKKVRKLPSTYSPDTQFRATAFMAKKDGKIFWTGPASCPAMDYAFQKKPQIMPVQKVRDKTDNSALKQNKDILKFGQN